MAGFLDKKSRIIDMVLTGYGKELLSKGELRFVSWVPFDDDVDYDPPLMNSGSLSETALAEAKLRSIEDTITREATTGYRKWNMSGSDHTNAHRPMFDMPQGQTLLPVLTSSVPSELTLEVKQRKVSDLNIKRDSAGRVLEQLGPFDRGFERYSTSDVEIEFHFPNGSWPADMNLNGLLVRVFESGSDGLTEVSDRRDIQGNLSFSNDLVIVADPENE